jgi:hypothetical protein
MARTTRAQLDRLAGSVSNLLPAGLSVEVASHSGRQHVDLYREQADGSLAQVRTLRAGTSGEMYEWLLAMQEALCLVRDHG